MGLRKVIFDQKKYYLLLVSQRIDAIIISKQAVRGAVQGASGSFLMTKHMVMQISERSLL
jgi:hypothetical protein